MIAVVAALPRELAALVRGVAPEKEAARRGVWLYRLPNAVAVAAGMGVDRVSMAVAAALADGKVDTLLSTGLAGACSPEWLPGTVAEAGLVVDVRTGERYTADVRDGVVLATSAVIASVTEKARLAAAYAAAMVDMEAAAVARLARAHGVGFRAIKGVSDAHDFELEGLAKFAGPRGEFRTGAFALHTALRPATWSKAMTLGRHSHQALAALTERLREEIALN